MSETKEYNGKVYRQVQDYRDYRCDKCCFFKNDQYCHSPKNGFDMCHWERFYWEEVKGEKR